MLTNFTIRQLQYFVAAAEAGSTTEAAERFFIHQSSMSAALTELEKTIGVQLFLRRRGQGIELTVTGRQLLPEARRLLRTADDFATQADSLRAGLAGPLDIGCFNTIAPAVLPELIGEFGLRHTEVDLHVNEAGQDALTAQLLSGTIELAVMYDFELPASLEVEPLYEPITHALLAPTHPLAGRESLSLGELADDPFLLIDTMPAKQLITEVFRETGTPMRVRFSSTNFDLLRALVYRGLGYCLISQPRGTNPRHWRDDSIAVPLNDPLDPVRVVVARAAGVQLTRRAREFQQFATDHYAAFRSA